MMKPRETVAGLSTLFQWRNPLVNRGAGISFQQIPFDDSIDGTYPLECFFQMPKSTLGIKSARVWVQRKPFRTYNSAGAAAATSSAAGGDGANTSMTGTHPGTGSLAHSASGDHTGTHAGHGTHTGTHAAHSSVADDSYRTHDHATGVNSGITAAHSHDAHADHVFDHSGWDHANHTLSHSASATHTLQDHVLAHNHGTHDHFPGSSHSHGVSLTPGIFESGPTGTLSLAVADDGVTYGAALTSGVNAISDFDLLPNLTKASGDKRLRISGTGLMRVQVLLTLELEMSVF